MNTDPNTNSAFVHKQWASMLGNLLQMLAGAIQLTVLTIGVVGFAVLDLVLGSFVLGKLGVHGATLDIWVTQIQVPAGFIALIVSAALSGAKLGAWDALLSQKVKGYTAWGVVVVMVTVSLLDVLFNVAFAGYYVRGIVPQEIIASQAGILETLLALSLGVLTFFDAPMLVHLIHHLKNHK